jgi:hypothetical protein
LVLKGQTDGGYRAFISYSHADRRIADWLHSALERYRLPAKLVGEQTALGPVPPRLGAMFRDRDELPAAGDLSKELVSALKRSMFLIVICSPAAAQSKWVNEEVRQFKLLHGRKRGDGTARVLALIADGDPADPGGGDCFPAALKFHVLPDGSVSSDPAEPIAADIRPGGDGKRLALLKLVAGLTGLPLDALVQREAARRQRRAAVLTGASLVLTGVMAVLTVLAVQGRREAERQRAQADGLIEYMLTDLREKLEPVGRLEVMDSVGQRALAYYEAQELGALDPDALGRRARALHLVGEVRDLRGDSEGALKAFREAERTTAELLARDPENPDRMFDHAQSLFWVGQTAWARKDWATAEERFRTYAELADAMLATDRTNRKWQAEVGYAANSLGALYRDTGRTPEAVTQFKRYVAVATALAAAKPDDSAAAWESSQAHAWLADAQLAAGDLRSARAQRMAELEILAALRAEDPQDSQVRMSMVRAQTMLSAISLTEGRISEAVQRAAAASSEAEPLLAQDPANGLWRNFAADAANKHAEAQILAGRVAEAAGANRLALAHAVQLAAADKADPSVQTDLLWPARWMEIAILFAKGDRSTARAGLADMRAQFRGIDKGLDSQQGATSFLMLHVLESADLASSGKTAEAQGVAAQGAALSIRAPTPTQAALKAHLEEVAAGRRARGAAPEKGAGYPVSNLVALFSG